MLERHLDKKSIVHLRKTTDRLLIAVNKTEGSSKLIENYLNIKYGNNTLELYQGITVEVSVSLVVRWVIKKKITRRSNDDITAQLKAENHTLQITMVEKILIRNSISTTAALVNTEGSEIPARINWNNCQHPTEAFITRVQQCSWCQKCRHTRANWKSDAICRFCAVNHAFSECPLAKEVTNRRKTSTNRKYANCFGNHGPLYLGWPSLQDSKEAMKLSMQMNLPYKEARIQYEATSRLTKTNNFQIHHHHL